MVVSGGVYYFSDGGVKVRSDSSGGVRCAIF